VGGSADSWQNQLLFFSELGYEVVAPDLLGHGFSSTPDRANAYTFSKLFHDTLTVFDHFCVAGGRQVKIIPLDDCPEDISGANPTTSSYNATGSLWRFEIKKIFFYFEKCSSLLQRRSQSYDF
jgi:hypothetical protein